MRLDTRPSSTTTSSSTHDAPALRRSVFNDGHDVRVRSRTTSASIRVHGPWQITATGLPASKKAWMKDTTSSSVRNRSGFATPPGRMRPS